MSRFRNTTLAIALVMLLAALVVGCGGGSSDSDSTAADRDANTTQQRPGSEQQAELRDCLERNGADLPSPPESGEGGPPGGMPPIGGGQGGPPGAGDPSELRDALEECGVDPSELPGRPGGRGGPPMGESIDAFVACVRENGYDLPDPDTSGDGPVFDPSEVDQDDPDFKKASQACQDKLRPSSPPDSSDSDAG